MTKNLRKIHGQEINFGDPESFVLAGKGDHGSDYVIVRNTDDRGIVVVEIKRHGRLYGDRAFHTVQQAADYLRGRGIAPGRNYLSNLGAWTDWSGERPA